LSRRALSVNLPLADHPGDHITALGSAPSISGFAGSLLRRHFAGRDAVESVADSIFRQGTGV
jgi:hypothetical protein